MPVTGVETQGAPRAIASSSTVGRPSRLPSAAYRRQVLLELEAQPNPITVVEAATTRTTRRALAARLNR